MQSNIKSLFKSKGFENQKAMQSSSQRAAIDVRASTKLYFGHESVLEGNRTFAQFLTDVETSFDCLWGCQFGEAVLLSIASGVLSTFAT